jgi:indole-3-glycerol phosphate synthase
VILDQIVTATRQSLAQRKQQTPLAELEHSVSGCETPRDFRGGLRGGKVEFITEVKRASPSRGWLCPQLDVTTLVQSYAQGGAAAISVLTEPSFFKGSFADLATARQAVDLPSLCKDFILDPYQVYEARAHGADAVLLIAAILKREELTTLIELAHWLGMASLVEVHNEQEIEKAILAKAGIIGVNNRNLADFSLDLKTTIKLRPFIPSQVTVVSESGINSFADILALQAARVDAVLVGEALVTSPDPKAKLKELMGEGVVS